MSALRNLEHIGRPAHNDSKGCGGVLAALIFALIDGASLPAALATAKALLQGQAGHEETLHAIEQAEKLAASDLPAPLPKIPRRLRHRMGAVSFHQGTPMQLDSGACLREVPAVQTAIRLEGLLT